MPTAKELYDSRKEVLLGDAPQATLLYLVTGCSSSTDPEGDALTAVMAEAPTWYTDLSGVARDVDLHIDRFEILERIGVLGSMAFRVAAYYRLATDAELDVHPVKIEISTTGGTEHITQSIAQTEYGAGTTDNDRAIGYHGERVEGVDVVVPAIRMSETWQIEQGTVDVPTYAGLNGKVNNDVWRGWAAGEVLFLGADIDGKDTDEFWAVKFNFSIRSNQTGLAVGTITGISKKGHELLDVRYTDAIVSGKVYSQPVSVYVHQVYPSGNFTALGIGS